MKTFARWLLRAVLALLVLLVLALVAVFALRTWLLPDLTGMQPRIEAKLSETLKQPVRLKGMSAEWNWASADVLVKQIEIGPDNAAALTLADAHVRVQLHPLAWGELQTEFITVGKAAIHAHQTGTAAAPQWWVAGFDMAKPSDGEGLRWLLKQNRLSVDSLTLNVQDAAKHWLPEQKTQIKLSQIAINNSGNAHRVQAQLADGFDDARLGSSASFKADFTHAWLKDTAKFDNWSGEAKISLPNAHIAASTAWAVQLLDAQNKRATWREWQRWAQQSIAKANLASTSSFVFKQGVLSGSGHTSLSGLPQQGADAIAPFNWIWTGNSALNDAHTFSVDSAKLSLTPLAAFMQTMPLPSAMASALRQAKPKGELTALTSKLSVSAKGLHTLELSATAAKLGLNTLDLQGAKGLINVPAIEGVSGKLLVSHTPDLTRSTFKLDSSQASTDLPRLLAESRVGFDRIQGDIEVSLSAKETRLKLTKLRFNNADIDGQIQGEFSIATRRNADDKALGLAKFTGDFARADLAQLHRYMPLTLSDSARDWLRHTIAQGEARNLMFNLNGDLSRFPFLPETAQAGERFDLQTAISKAVLNLNPLNTDAQAGKVLSTSFANSTSKQWPLIEAVSGELRLQGLSFSLLNMEGTLKPSEAGVAPLPVHMPKLTIASLAAPVVVFQTRATAPAASVLALVRNSPLSQAAGNQLSQLKTNSGTVSVDANLTLDLARPDKNLTQGTLKLDNVSLDISRDLPPLERINATLAFKQNRLTVEQANARWLDGDIMVSGALDTIDSSQTLRIQGNAHLAAVKQYLPNPMVQALLSHATGALDYNLALSFKPAGWHWEITADLNDTALQWPGLLDKAAGVPLPFSLTRKPIALTTAALGGQNVSQDIWEATLGATVLGPFKAVVERRKQGDDWRLLRGAVALGAQAELNAPDEGLGVHLVTPVVNLDRLQADIAALPWATIPTAPKPSAQAISVSAGTRAVTYTPAQKTPPWMPSVIALQVDDLTVSGRRFSNIVAAAIRISTANDTAQYWRGNLIAKGINGYVTWSDDLQNDGFGKGQLLAKLTELTIPVSDIQSTSKALLDVSPEQIPSIDLTVDALILGDKALGAIALKADHLIDGKLSKGWNIEQLTVTQPHATFTSKGSWTRASGAETGLVKLKLDLSSDSLGDALNGLGFGKVLAGTAGNLSGEVRWNGSPFNLDIPSLSGQLKADFEKGQFLKVDPGAARLLSLFSLQNLPRRLTLDFKDTFGTGFAFDTVTASATITNGLLKTDDFLMQSSVAKVTAAGEVSLEKETQSLLFTVKPEINAGSVSLLYMIINPPVGLATLAAQWLFKEPLSKALTIEYSITGSWAKPDIKQLKREFR